LPHVFLERRFLRFNGVSGVRQNLQKMEYIIEASMFAKVIDGIKNVNEMGNIDFSPRGLEISVVDPFCLSLSFISFRSTAFKFFTFPDTVFAFGINFKHLSRLLNNADGNLKLKLNGDKLEVTVDKPIGTIECRMNLMSPICFKDNPQTYSIKKNISSDTALGESIIRTQNFGDILREMSGFSENCEFFQLDHSDYRPISFSLQETLRCIFS